MFEYAFLYSLIKRKGCSPKIKAFKHYDENEDKRIFALSPFSISLKFDLKDEKKGFNFFSLLIMKRKILILKNQDKSFEYLNSLLIKKDVYYSNNVSFLKIDDNTLKNTTLVEGYFQSYLYFNEFRKDIVDEFKFVEPIKEKNRDILNEIKRENSVCVHIRRGDYLNSYYAPRFKLCEYDYYKQAMDYVIENTENPVFYVFSNNHFDVEWIKENYDFSNYNVKYVDLGNKDYEDLQLMISCKHFIISNSTYSWWAQYLSENENKIVVSPSKWRRNEKEKSQLIMPNFKLIDVE